MLHPLRHLQAAVLCLTLLPATALSQQQEAERPRVERLTFRGVDAVDERELRRSIATGETRCRSILLRPFCWVTDWELFVQRAYLDRDEVARDELRLEVRYFQRGYRHAVVRGEVRPRDDGVEVVFEVEEGAPTVVASREVHQSREVLSGRQIRWAGLPAEGGPLDLIRLDSALVQLQEEIENAGYLDASISDSIRFHDGNGAASLAVLVEPGPRSVLASFDIQGNRRVSDGVIVTGTVLRPGRVIRRSDLTSARRSLYESNLFHEVDVTVPPQPDSAKRVAIAVREAPPRLGRAGGGFNTVEFVQLEGRFAHHNWGGGGRRLDARATVGNLLARQLNDRGIFSDVIPEFSDFEDESPFFRPTWQVSVELQQPGFRAAENTIGTGVFATRRLVPGVAVDQSYGADVTLTRLLRDRSPTSLAYRAEVTRIEAGELYFCVNYGLCDLPTVDAVRRPRRLSPASASLSMDHSDDPLDPVRGWRARLDLEHASDLTWSQFHFHRASGAWAQYFPFNRGRNVLALRVRGGWVRPLGGSAEAVGLEDIEGEILHPRKRFYAGGATSVRGYGENQLGPRILTVSPDALMAEDVEGACTADEIADGSCDPNFAPVDAFEPRALGGTSVIQANVEYRFHVWRALQGAVFVDGAHVGGREAARVGTGSWAVTPGLGARYTTPVGPVRVDLGFNPSQVEELEVVTERLDEDGVLQLVRLDTPRRYDPLEDVDGFFGQLLGRLRLHISIGQAF